MDIVHHTLIGGAGLLGASAFDAPLVGVAFMIGSVWPDLDVVFMFFGKRFYLRHHQAITHGLPLAPLYAALPLIDWTWAMFFGALAGILLHVGLDWLNTFRIGLFSPFSSKRYSADAVFFIDAVTLALTGLFYLFYAIFDLDPLLWVNPAFFTAYLAAKWWLRRWVQCILKPLYAIPSSLNPLEFYVLEAGGEGCVGYLFNTLTGKKRQLREYPPIALAHQQFAEKSAFSGHGADHTALRITEVIEDGTGTTIRADDVAVRNFGGRFGRTELQFDRDGKLIREMANRSAVLAAARHIGRRAQASAARQQSLCIAALSWLPFFSSATSSVSATGSNRGGMCRSS